jgi:ParB family transcriptional regulator, chromosome partitioning protein
VAKVATLQEISPDKIYRNPENPRIFFHEAEMLQLMNSIKEVGIKVPITTYESGTDFVLLDGERRWRCAKRLNLRLIPAIVQEKPSPLENLLMMFNIHNVREDWDLMETAKKIGDIREMLKRDNKKHDERAISALTGVTVTTVRRSFEILDLPTKYFNLLMKEASKPKAEQRIRPDLFLEIYKSLHAVERYIPEVFNEVTKHQFVDSMVKKYSSAVIDNVISFRDLSKIARAERAGVDRAVAIPAVVRLVQNKKYDITTAYAETVERAYQQRDLVSKIDGITEKLSHMKRKPSADVVAALRRLDEQVHQHI